MAEETKQTPKLELIKASEIDPKSVDWLWFLMPENLKADSFGAGKSIHLLTPTTC